MKRCLGAYSLVGKPNLLTVWNNKGTLIHCVLCWEDFINKGLRAEGEFIWDAFLEEVYFEPPPPPFYNCLNEKFKHTEKWKE